MCVYVCVFMHVCAIAAFVLLSELIRNKSWFGTRWLICSTRQTRDVRESKESTKLESLIAHTYTFAHSSTHPTPHKHLQPHAHTHTYTGTYTPADLHLPAWGCSTSICRLLCSPGCWGYRPVSCWPCPICRPPCTLSPPPPLYPCIMPCMLFGTHAGPLSGCITLALAESPEAGKQWCVQCKLLWTVNSGGR